MGNFSMGSHPDRGSFCLTIWQQIYDPMGIQVHQDGAEGSPTRDARNHQCPDTEPALLAASEGPSLGEQSSSRKSLCQDERRAGHPADHRCLIQSLEWLDTGVSSFVLKASNQLRESFSENFSRTVGGVAKELADVKN
jgi:hypothetical protein